MPPSAPERLAADLRAAAFGRKIAVALVLFNVVVAAMGALSAWHSRRETVQNAQIGTANMAMAMAQNVGGLLDRVDLVLLSARDEIEQRAASGNVAADVDAFLERLAARLPEASALRVADAAGRVMRGGGADPGASIAGRSHFVGAREAAGAVIGQPVQARTDRKWVLPIARRISARDGSFAGIVYVLVELDRLGEDFARFDVGQYGGIALRDRETRLILRAPELEGVGARGGDPSLSQALKDALAAGRTAAEFTAVSPADGRRRVAAVRKVGVWPLYVVATQAEEEYLAPWRLQARWIVLLVLAFVGVSLWSGRLLAGSVRRRLAVVHSLVDSQQRLAESERRLHALLDASSETTLLLDTVGKVLAINAVGARRFGLAPEAMKGRNFFDFLPDELAQIRRAQLQEVVAAGEPTHTQDHRGAIAFDNSIYPVKDDGGAVKSIAIYAKDVTEQLRTQKVDAMFHRLDLMLLKWRMDLESIAQQFADEMLPLFDLTAVWIARAETGGALTLLARAGEDERSGAFVECLRAACAANEGACCAPARAVLAGGQMQRAGLCDGACAAACGDAARAAGVAAVLLLPLTLRGATWGVLAMYARSGGLFDRIDIPPRLAGIAGRLCTSLEASLQQEWLTLLDTALETSGNAVFITGADGRIVWVNRSFTELSGYGRAELIGQTPRLFRSGVQDAEFYGLFWRAIQAGETWHGEIVNARRDGGRYTVNQTVTPLVDAAGSVSHFVAIVEDISERKAAQARIEYMATYDMLTALPNRALFFDRLGQALSLARRDGQAGALLFLDLDRFKQVNDQLGHEAGDALLKAAAIRLREQVRESDTVARLAGDEFTILLPHVAGPQDAEQVAAKVVAAIGRPFDLAGHAAQIGVSVGIALFPADGDGVEAIVAAADAAMYLAKQAGRNTFRFHGGGVASD